MPDAGREATPAGCPECPHVPHADGHCPICSCTAPAYPDADRKATGPCAVNVRRATMSDEDYWADVAASLGHPQDVDYEPDDDPLDPPAVTVYDSPCAVCGTTGPCAYDANGLPLIHADEEVV